ncbi:MAG TPA: GspH/FimT family pseudopilin [Thermoanaerobaculia bacterium]|nr:GspH/FimT family pseudopilin [Thermoanaerobaculia bacterium]
MTAETAPNRPRPRRGTATAGFTLLELLVATALAATILVASVPPILDASRRLRLATAAAEASRALHLARSYAVRHSAHVGVRLTTDPASGRVTWALYRDGDGDGVLARDVRSGDDPRIGGTGRALAHTGTGIRLGFPPVADLRDPSGARLGRRDDPVRFNRSDVASFGPTGTATPGSLYLTDGRDGLACVRVTSRTGRVRVLIRDPETGEWE